MLSSSCSTLTLLLLFVQSRSPSEYVSLGSISKRSPPVAEKYATSTLPVDLVVFVLALVDELELLLVLELELEFELPQAEKS